MNEPHEGVVGVDRSDNDLLSLDLAAIAHREALMWLADHLWSATLVGHPAPKVKEMYDRIRQPCIGDLVVEVSAMYERRNPERRMKGLGFLVEHRVEWDQTAEEWEQYHREEPDEPRPTDTAWYIQYGPDAADICRWTNCSFIVVPIERELLSQPGERIERC